LTEEAKWRIFLCPYSEQELRARNYAGALNYVNWGGEQRTTGKGRMGKTGVPFPEVESVRTHRPHWFNLPEHPPGHVIANRFIGERFGFPVNPGLIISDTFFEISFPHEKELYSAMLNSTLTFFFVELMGRHTWAQGVLYLYGPELRDLPVPNALQIPPHLQARIKKAFSTLKRHPILPIAEELRRTSRRTLDEAVLEALGLNPVEYLPKIYRGLVEMVRERLAMSKLRTACKKEDERLSLEQLKEKVRQEALAGGLKPITAFLPAGNPPMMDVPLAAQPVSWSGVLTEYTLLDARGNEVGKIQGNECQARYAVYAAQLGQYMVQVPADPVVACKVVEEYEQYLRREARELFQRLLEATHDQRQADRLRREILGSLKLPPPAIQEATRE
jgi:hypothetical protein